MRHPHYEIIKALIEDTSLGVEVKLEEQWEERCLSFVVEDVNCDFEWRH